MVIAVRAYVHTVSSVNRLPLLCACFTMLLQSVLHLRARERPHVIIDPSSGDLTHLITGAADPCPPGVNCSAGCREWNASPWNINGKTVVRWTRTRIIPAYGVTEQTIAEGCRARVQTPLCDPAGCGQNIGCPGADHSFTLVQPLKR